MTGEAARRESEKRRRCALAKCPEFGTGNPKCAVCTGPVAVMSGGRWTCGRARSCHGCAMDGLGLAVCWACCPGPNQSFATDGQRIVSADSSESPDELVAHMADRRLMSERTGGGGRGMNDLDASSADAQDGDFEAALNAVRRVMRFTSVEWEQIRRLVVAGDARSIRQAADRIGIARNLLVRKDSATRRIVARLAEIGRGDWDVVRTRIANASTTESGAMLGVTKQAVSKREASIRARHAWYGRFVESLANADRPFFVANGVITPRKPSDTRFKPHGHEHRAQAGARDTGSLSHPDSGCQD